MQYHKLKLKDYVQINKDYVKKRNGSQTLMFKYFGVDLNQDILVRRKTKKESYWNTLDEQGKKKSLGLQ